MGWTQAKQFHSNQNLYDREIKQRLTDAWGKVYDRGGQNNGNALIGCIISLRSLLQQQQLEHNIFINSHNNKSRIGVDKGMMGIAYNICLIAITMNTSKQLQNATHMFPSPRI